MTMCADKAVVQVGTCYVVLPAKQAMIVFEALQAGEFVETDYAQGFKYSDDKYKRITLEYLRPEALAKLELGRGTV
jgi:hypothetical protein